MSFPGANRNRLDEIIEMFQQRHLLDLVHTLEDLTAQKASSQLIRPDQINLLEYLLGENMDELYPITDNSDYTALGAIFNE